MSIFQPKSFEVFRVGKIFKGSKKRFSWKILLDGLDYLIDMYYSKISGKVKIFVNNELALETKATERHNYKFNIRYRPLVIDSLGEVFDLKYGRVSADAVLSGRQKIENFQRAEREERKVVSSRSQTRKSLPASLPSTIPTVQFRKQVVDIDLLEIDNKNPSNPFDPELPSLTHNMYSTGAADTKVPWPRSNPFSSYS